MKKTLLRRWPLYASLLVFALLVRLVLTLSLRQNRGCFVYALDDAYIHMAMARNLALHGVWGVTRFAFTSSSSSMLWTLLLSMTYKLFGASPIAPLLWNLLFAVLILVAAYAILTWYKVAAVLKFAALLALIFLVPLPTLVLSGMEQTLQSLLVMVTVFLAARVLAGEAPRSVRRDTILLLVLAPLITGVRFEGMFVIIALCILFLMGKRWWFAAAFAACGFLPVVIYGIISESHGWFWLPSSVLLKGVSPDLTSLRGLSLSLAVAAFINLYKGIHVYVLLISVLIVYIMACTRGRSAFESRQVMGAALLLTALPHMEFIQVGPLFRYDAYLLVLGVLFIAAQLPVVMPGLMGRALFDPRGIGRSPAGARGGQTDPPRPRLDGTVVAKGLSVGALALLLFFPLAVKGSRLLWFLPQCTKNIYEQQYQMGLFIHQYYEGAAVALNDVGAVNYLADIHCIDLWGLANRDVTALKRAHRYYTADIDSLTKQAGARIAILYDHWYGGCGGLPREWVRVGQWTIPGNVIDGGDTVSFYAVDPSEALRLSECLREFSVKLPPDVAQSGSYLDWNRLPASQ